LYRLPGKLCPIIAGLTLFIFLIEHNKTFATPTLPNELGKGSQVWRLNLFAKNPATWQIIEGGATGEITICRTTGSFRLKAVGLHPYTEYALVRYQGRPPFGQVLMRIITDKDGTVTSAGSWKQWTGKFWLVLGKDLKGYPDKFKTGMQDKLKAWRPAEYLFESEELRADTD